MSPPVARQKLQINPQLCLGCRSCEMACALSHSGHTSYAEAVLSGEPLSARITVVKSGTLLFPVQCQQCERAPCAQVCPTQACEQQVGRVTLDESRCIGCKRCLLACPFGAISLSPSVDSAAQTGVTARKCDLCDAWRQQYHHAETACMQACPTQAITLIDPEHQRQQKLRASASALLRSQSR